MLPLPDAHAMRAIDAATVAREPIASIGLMERAASRCAGRILHHHHAGRFGDPEGTCYRVVVGMGNNGGDGLVVARLLHEAGIPVRVDRVLHRSGPSPDHAANLQRVLAVGVDVRDITHAEELLPPEQGEVIVDALFGMGLNAPVQGLAAGVIAALNAMERPVIALDMPSGLFPEDNAENDPKGIIRATLTLAIGLPKLALLLPENAAFVGDHELVPIGLDVDAIREHQGSYAVIEEEDVQALLRPRPRFGHKGTFGHAVVMAGSRGMMGAAVLATRAALRSGTGLVTAHVPAVGLQVLQTTAPEALCSVDPEEYHLSEPPSIRGITALCVGPGMGMNDATAGVLKRLIQDPPAPLVLDADALNILAVNRTWLAFLPPGTVLTPHPGEFDRLHGEASASGYQRLQRARELARKTGSIVVLKGAWTAVCAPDGRVVFNPTGNPGMAKGGSGDVLAGLLTGLLAQGHPPMAAALLGVYVHGLAGDIAAQRLGMDGMTPADLVEAIPEAWKRLRNASEETLQ